MQHPFVPLVLLLLLPLGYFAQRLGGLDRVLVRWGLGLCGVAVLGAGVIAGGVDYPYLKRMNLGLAVAVALVVALHRLGAGWLDRRRYRAALVALAVVAWVVHLNFFAFHGTGQTRTYLQLHDVAHYYLGSKYFRELGYPDLYTGMLRAEAELYDNHFRTVEARDLRSNMLVDIRVLLSDSNAVKAQFTPQRWTDFKQDVAYFHEAMGPQFADVLHDFGYNPTPVWTLIGGGVANLVPAGSVVGIGCLGLLDLSLEAVMFLAIAWAFGVEAMLLAMIYFCILFGASFGWIGGAFMRYLWLFGLVVGVCCLQRGRYAAAGGLIALAALLRVFPAVFMVGMLAKASRELVASRRVSGRYARALASFAGTVLVLLGLTLVQPGGIRHWEQFRSNMERLLSDNVPTNFVGLTEVLAYRGALDVTAERAAQTVERHETVHRWQLLVLGPLLLVFIVRRGRTDDDLTVTLLAVPLIFSGLSIACYYYVLMLPLVCAYRDDAERLVLLFGIEAATYALLLFEDREIVLYFYRNLLLLYLLVALLLDPVRAELAAIAPPRRAGR